MAKLVVFKDGNFNGERHTITKDAIDMPAGWNDCISSFIVESGSWILYKDGRFNGDSWEVHEKAGMDGDGRFPVMKPTWNDCISSIKLTSR